MDQNSIVQASFSLFNNKGAYALLLGSGVSRSSGIPTGWEITNEMIRQLATMLGESAEPSPEQWYLLKFGKVAGYSELLDRLGKTPTERHSYLRPFFEPTQEEREDGKKSPTPAHRAIAGLVAAGFIKVIVTTNFDRLLEVAIQDAGIVPTVIASPDSVEGATPLVHSRCTIIKVNGDYLDTRAKNTEAELQDYDQRLQTLLDRVFDEFGLIVCGWSGEWDQGLRAAIERTKGRRYSCYWCSIGEPAAAAEDLIELRGAQVLAIQTADQFFGDLAEKVSAISDLNKAHPLSPQIAVSTLKKFIAEDRYRIRLHDLLMDEVARVAEGTGPKSLPTTGALPPTGELLQARINTYFSIMTIMTPLFIQACHWSRKQHDDLLIKAISRLSSNTPETDIYYPAYESLRRFPGAILLYGGGIAAIEAGRFDLLKSLLSDFKVKAGYQETTLPFEQLHLFKIMEQVTARTLPGREREFTPLHNVVFDYLREQFKDLIPHKDDFKARYDLFEFLACMHFAEQTTKGEPNGEAIWVPVGRSAWDRGGYDRGIPKLVSDEIDRFKDNWPPLKHGLFNGQHERAAKLAIGVKKVFAKVPYS